MFSVDQLNDKLFFGIALKYQQEGTLFLTY